MIWPVRHHRLCMRNHVNQNAVVCVVTELQTTCHVHVFCSHVSYADLSKNREVMCVCVCVCLCLCVCVWMCLPVSVCVGVAKAMKLHCAWCSTVEAAQRLNAQKRTLSPTARRACGNSSVALQSLSLPMRLALLIVSNSRLREERESSGPFNRKVPMRTTPLDVDPRCSVPVMFYGACRVAGQFLNPRHTPASAKPHTDYATVKSLQPTP